jgi:hypothetical protein
MHHVGSRPNFDIFRAKKIQGWPATPAWAFRRLEEGAMIASSFCFLTLLQPVFVTGRLAMADTADGPAAAEVVQVATATPPSPQRLYQSHWRPPPPPDIVTPSFAVLPDGSQLPVHRVHQFPSAGGQPGAKAASRQAKPLIICLDGTNNEVRMRVPSLRCSS